MQYKAIVKAFAKPIDVKYVSFASSDGNRVLYFYNCDDEKAAKTILPVPASNAHPYFAEPTELNEDALAKKCKHTHAWEDVYSTPVKLDSIKNIAQDGYVVRIPLLVKGVRDAQILLQSGNSANPKDGYEIGELVFYKFHIKFFFANKFSTFFLYFLIQFSVDGAIQNI